MAACPADRPRLPGRLRSDQPAFWQEVFHLCHQRGGGRRGRRAGLRPPGFLDHKLQQAAELHPAHQHHSESHRQGRRRGAG